MKKFVDFIQLDELQDPDQLNETTLRTMSAVVLTAKIRSLQNQITSIKIRPNEPLPSSMTKLFLKLDLISNQNFITSILVSQTALMDK